MKKGTIAIIILAILVPVGIISYLYFSQPSIPEIPKRTDRIIEENSESIWDIARNSFSGSIIGSISIGTYPIEDSIPVYRSGLTHEKISDLFNVVIPDFTHKYDSGGNYMTKGMVIYTRSNISWTILYYIPSSASPTNDSSGWKYVKNSPDSTGIGGFQLLKKILFDALLADSYYLNLPLVSIASNDSTRLIRDDDINHWQSWMTSLSSQPTLANDRIIVGNIPYEYRLKYYKVSTTNEKVGTSFGVTIPNLSKTGILFYTLYSTNYLITYYNPKTMSWCYIALLIGTGSTYGDISANLINAILYQINLRGNP